MALKGIVDRHTSWPVQRAVLALLTDGQLERHIRRARRRYAESRAILRECLAPIIESAHSPARLLGLEAGLHACLEFTPDLDTMRIVRAARERGVAAGPLADYYYGPAERQGLVLGYGGLSHPDLARGAQTLSAVIAAEWGRRTGRG